MMQTVIDWNDAAARARLVAAVGPAAYEEARRQHVVESAVASVGEFLIVPISSRFGRLFSVHGTGRAFSTQRAAEQFAATLPARACNADGYHETPEAAALVASLNAA